MWSEGYSKYYDFTIGVQWYDSADNLKSTLVETAAHSGSGWACPKWFIYCEEGDVIKMYNYASQLSSYGGGEGGYYVTLEGTMFYLD